MKVLVICSHYPPQLSPEAQHAFLLCEHLARSGVDVHLLTSPLQAGAPAPHGFTIHPEITAWNWSGAWKIIRATRRIRPDTVLLLYVSWIYSHHPMITFAPWFLQQTTANIRVITQFEHTDGAPDLAPFRQRLRWHLTSLLAGRRRTSRKFGTLLSTSDALIVLSQLHRDELERACPAAADRITLIPAPALLATSPEDNGRARLQGRQLLGLGADTDTVVLSYFGFIYEGKGVETLLAAAAQLRERAPAGDRSYLIVITGSISPGFEEKLQRRRNELPLDAHVKWMGYQPDAQASLLLWGSDAAILPFDAGAQLNNSSLAVCALHGLPIVTTRADMPEPAFRDMENVMLCPPRDPATLAATMEMLINSPALREQLGRGARALARASFSWEVTIPATRSVLRSVWERPNHQRPRLPVRAASPKVPTP